MSSMEVTATVNDIKRNQNSESGNPRWTLYTTHGMWKTKTDTMCAYQISEAMVGKVVTLDIECGYIIGVEAKP